MSAKHETNNCCRNSRNASTSK